MTDEELLEYISESSTMSKAMDEYEGALPWLPGRYHSSAADVREPLLHLTCNISSLAARLRGGSCHASASITWKGPADTPDSGLLRARQ